MTLLPCPLCHAESVSVHVGLVEQECCGYTGFKGTTEPIVRKARVERFVSCSRCEFAATTATVLR